MFKKIVQRKLRFFAKIIIAKYQPKIVGITGSVGKTSAREAVSAVLKEKFRVRSSLKNYNNEFGLPLTIVGAASAGRNFFGWAAIFLKALALCLFKDRKYPEILVLEMGVDKPGDMRYLLDIARPDIAIVTMIGLSHLESFKDIYSLRKEKGELVAGLKKGGWAILNADSDGCLKIKEENQVPTITYGFDKGADVWASNLLVRYKESKDSKSFLGNAFKLTYQGSTVPISLPRSIGEPAVYAALAAACVGIHFQMNLVEIADALETFDSPKGRLKVIDGIKNTILIDDTYNASPQSSLAAVKLVGGLKPSGQSRKIAVLGDMLELGSESEQGHRDVGRSLFENGFDLAIAVGERAADIARAALESGMDSGAVFHFDKNDQAGRFVQKQIKPGDIILIKGSQGARMERITKELMADPLHAAELLVRQEEEWLEK